MIFSDINNPTFAEIDAFLQKNDTIKYFKYPVFTRYVNVQRQRCETETNDMKRFVNMIQVFIVANSIRVLSNVWPNIPNDHFTTYFPLLKKGFRFERFETNSQHRGMENPKVVEWLQQHCPDGKRFLSMLFQNCKRSGEQITRNHQEPTFLEQKYGEESDYKLAKSTTDPDVLKELALMKHHGILYQVAKNVHTSPETLEQMLRNPKIYEDICPFIIDVIVANPNTPSDVKTIFCLDRGYEQTDQLLVDTLKQLEDMRNKNYEVPTTVINDDGTESTIKRWRLQVFHDHISFLYLCQSVENVTFKGVTLKDPYKEGEWTVYSPIDSLGLALWAHKVRNCVRSREENVQSGKSEIVCIELNGEPNCTVEINGASSRKSEGLRIKEIQRRGLSTGMTTDEDGVYFNLVQRALNSVK